MFKLAVLSLRNRALIALVTVFVMVFGVITTSQLKEELIPSLTIPTAVVVTTYPGASPAVVEERVTVPIEQSVLGLSGLESSSSDSATGTSTVIVRFAWTPPGATSPISPTHDGSGSTHRPGVSTTVYCAGTSPGFSTHTTPDPDVDGASK